MLTKLIIMDAFLWSGMILGISFLESWVKFRAPTLLKPVGLDVGRTVFRFFHRAQNGLLVILIFLSILIKLEAIQWAAIVIVTSILILQYLWLFPKLSQRADVIIAGNTLSDSYIHTLYGVLEVVKLLILITFGWILIP